MADGTVALFVEKVDDWDGEYGGANDCAGACPGLADWEFGDGGAPNAVKASLTCKPYADCEGLIELLFITGGATCLGGLIEGAGTAGI